MNAAQEAAFSAASGGAASSNMLFVIAAIVIVFLLVWFSWSSLKVLDRWRSGRSEFGHFGWHLVRAAMLVMVLAWWIN